MQTMSKQALYAKVLGAEQEKVASDLSSQDGSQEVEFEMDADFFNKVRERDEDHLNKLASFISSCEQQGLDEEQIETLVANLEKEAMDASDQVGEDQPEEGGDYEMQKQAMWEAGEIEALGHFIESDFAKERGLDIEKIAQFELGSVKGEAYFQTMKELERIGEKIASAEGNQDDGQLELAYGALKEAGFDMSAIDAQVQTDETGNIDVAYEILKHAGFDMSHIEAQASGDEGQVDAAYEILKQAGFDMSHIEAQASGAADVNENMSAQEVAQAIMMQQKVASAAATLEEAGFDLSKLAKDVPGMPSVGGRLPAPISQSSYYGPEQKGKVTQLKEKAQHLGGKAKDKAQAAGGYVASKTPESVKEVGTAVGAGLSRKGPGMRAAIGSLSGKQQAALGGAAGLGALGVGLAGRAAYKKMRAKKDQEKKAELESAAEILAQAGFDTSSLYE